MPTAKNRAEGKTRRRQARVESPVTGSCRQPIQITSNDLENLEPADDSVNWLQLDLLARAQHVSALFEQHARNRTMPKTQEALRSDVGQQLGISGREVGRYLCVRRVPKCVQDALAGGRLTLVEAGKVAGLKAEQQAAIERRIAAGEDARNVFESALKDIPGRRCRPSKKYNSFLKQLSEIWEEIPASMEEVSIDAASPSHVELLEKIVVDCKTRLRWEKASLRRQAPAEP